MWNTFQNPDLVKFSQHYWHFGWNFVWGDQNGHPHFLRHRFPNGVCVPNQVFIPIYSLRAVGMRSLSSIRAHQEAYCPLRFLMSTVLAVEPCNAISINAKHLFTTQSNVKFAHLYGKSGSSQYKLSLKCHFTLF